MRFRHLDSASPRHVHLVVWILVALVFALHVVTLCGGFFWNGDAAQLIVHARNLAEGLPYAQTGYIQNPDRYLAPVAYPPGFPLLMAPLVAALGPEHAILLPVLKIQMIGYLMGTIAVLAYMLRSLLPLPFIGLLILVLGLQPQLWLEKHTILTVLPFLFMALVAIAGYVHAHGVRDSHPRTALMWAAFAGAAACYAMLIRPSGIAVILSFAVYEVLKHRRLTRMLLVAAAAWAVLYGAQAVLIDTQAGAQVGPALTNNVTPEGGSYRALVEQDLVQHLDDIPERIGQRTVDYVRQATIVLGQNGFADPWEKVIRYALVGLLGGLVLWGFAYRAWRAPSPLEPFALLYLFTLLPWTFVQPWYFVPLIPLLYVYLVIGLWRLRERMGRRGTIGVGAVLVIVGVVYGGAYMRIVCESDQPEVTSPSAYQFYDYLRANTPPSATFMTTYHARHLMFFADRAASLAPEDTALWPVYARHIGATYLVVEADDPATQALDEGAEWMRLVVQNETFDLYALEWPASEGNK